MRKSDAKLSEESMKLRVYIKNKPEGAEVLYDDVFKDTGIKMDLAGRAKLRAAIVACNREWEVVKDIGYILDSTSSTIRIISHHVKKIHSQTVKTSRACTNLRGYRRSLDSDGRMHFDLVESVTNRMLVSTEKTVDKIYYQEAKRIQPNAPIIRVEDENTPRS